MKRIVLLITLCLAIALVFGDKTSTEEGGNWGDPGTWIEGGTPTSSDNVLINGPVTISGGSCANLTISSHGSLLNVAGINGLIGVFGSLTNTGTIGNNATGYLSVNLYTNLINDGTLNPRYLYLMGNTTQYLSGTSPLSMQYMTDNVASSAVSIGSDLTLNGTNIDLNYANLLLNDGSNRNLSIIGGLLSETSIRFGTASGTSGILTMGNGAYLITDNIYGICTFAGEILLASVVSFYGDLINNGILNNRAGNTINMSLPGSLTNYGTIRNNPSGGYLAITCGGLNFSNYGTISNNGYTLNRTSICNLYHDAAAPPISCGYLYASGTGAYQLMSDLRFANCQLNFNNKIIYTSLGATSFNIDVDGGSLTQQMILQGPPASFLTLRNTTAQNVNCQVSAVTEGTVYIAANNTFVGLTNGGILRNASMASFSTSVFGDLVNSSSGTIENYNGYHFTITVMGSLHNHGLLQNWEINLNNSSTVDLEHTSTLPIACSFLLSASTGEYQLLSSLSFNNCNVDFNGNEVTMFDTNGDYGITHTGSGKYLQDTIINGGPGSFITMGTDSYLRAVQADTIQFNGTVIIQDGVQMDNLTNNGTLINHSSGYYNLIVHQSLTNNGSILRFSDINFLNVYLGGDLYDNGTIACNRLAMIGAEICDLYQSNTAQPISARFFDSNPVIGGLQMRSDLSFANCYVLLNNNDLIMHDTNGQYGISLQGGYFKQAVIDGGEQSSLNLSNNCWIQNVSANVLLLMGNVICADGINIGRLINFGTLRDYYGSYTVNVTGKLENWGTITQSTLLNIALQGDLYNYGQIINNSILISGTPVHDIYQDAMASPIGCANFTVDGASGDLRLLTNLSFQNCTVNLGGKNLGTYPSDLAYVLSLDNSSVSAGVLPTLVPCTLAMSNNSWLSGVTAWDFIITGTAYIVTGATFGNLVNEGTIQNGTDSASLVCSGDLTNNGTIQNNPGGNVLVVYCRQGMTNAGSLLNQSVRVDGYEDQYLSLAGTVSLPGGMVLESQIGSVDWYFNGILDQAGLSEIIIDPAIFGVWQPQSGPIIGRHIIVGNGAPLSAPAAFIQPVTASGIPLLIWNQVPNALFYRVFMANEPYGEYNLWQDWVFDPDLSDGSVCLEIGTADSMKFFKITARN